MGKSFHNHRGIEKVFDWIKKWGRLRQFKQRGTDKVSVVFCLHEIPCNLIRMGNLVKPAMVTAWLGACRTLHRGPATVLEPWDSEISDRSCGELSQLLRPLLRLPGTASAV